MGSISPRESLPLAALAQMTAEEILQRQRRGESPMAADELARAIELALVTVVRGERGACAAECTRRSELWLRAADLAETSDVMRVEAEHRAKEAQYLSDLIATRG